MSRLQSIPKSSWPTTSQLAELAAKLWDHSDPERDEMDIRAEAIQMAINLWVECYCAIKAARREET